MGAAVCRRSSGNKYKEKGAPEEIEGMAAVPRERTGGECGKETLVCKKGGGGVLRVRNVHGEEIRQVKEFKYLGTVLCGALVAQWVVRPTHTRLVPGSKHDWCKNPLVFAMIAG